MFIFADTYEYILNASDITGSSKSKMIGGVEAVNRCNVATSLTTVGGISVALLLVEKAEVYSVMC